MVGCYRDILLAMALLAALGLQSKTFGQAAEPAPAPSKFDLGNPPPIDPLPNFPRPLDEPRSLFTQPKPMPLPPPLPGPYFEQDPLLDPPQLPAPGLFATVETGYFASHVKNHLANFVSIGAGPPAFVQLPSATLDWTVTPRFEVGYRLPSGFGEFVMGYRFLVTEGSGSIFGPDGIAALKSRLDVNVFDWDYASREYSLWPHCDMKWRLGVRLSYVYFDSRADEPFGLAAAGTGVFERRVSNSFVGVGPHSGLELSRRMEGTGLAFTSKLDLGTHLGRIRQGFFEESTTLNAAGQPLTGETRNSGSQAVPTLNVQAGVSWQPPACPAAHFFLGYQYERWWTLGQLADSAAELTDQGIFLRAEFNF